MRWFLLVLAAVVGALYFTSGVRLGVLPHTPAYYWNATGTNTYSLSVRTDHATVALSLDASLSSGAARLDLLGPGGTSLWSRRLGAGQAYRESQVVRVSTPGFYRMRVDLERTTGRLGFGWEVDNEP